MTTTLQKMDYCRICCKHTLHIYDEHSCNHILHLLLTLVTGGLWLLIWILAILSSYNTKPVCTICGGVMPAEMIKRLQLDREAERALSRTKWALRMKRISESWQHFLDGFFQVVDTLIHWLERTVNGFLHLVDSSVRWLDRIVKWPV